MEKLMLPQPIYRQIMDTIGANPAESGGVFAVRGNAVSEYCFDEEAGIGKRFYRPAAQKITEIVNRWIHEGHRFGGFIHSHGAGETQLSPMDIVTADRVMLANGLPFVYMAVVCEEALHLYKVTARPDAGRSELEECVFQITD